MKKYIKKFFYYISIALMLHSKAPTKEIKRIWEIFLIGGLPVLFFTLLSGEKIFIFLQLPKIDFINNYGGFLFWFFVLIYCIVFFNYRKSSEITAKQNQNHNKS